tara:strand:+ start:921 stop:1448 length:528 start_codon:yes stop_codon:yes gene_type:complete
MRLNNSITEYGLVAKLFHWLTFIILIIQIPLGFYLVRLDFSDLRVTLDEVHVIGGIIVFYLTLFRLIYKFFNKSPNFSSESFIGQKFIAKVNHFALYVVILTVTLSGIFKKLYNGEKLDFFIFKIRIDDNFDLADKFYEIHILSNYSLIALISLHILAVIFHKLFFKENILKRMT